MLVIFISIPLSEMVTLTVFETGPSFLSGPSGVARTHLFEDMPAGTLDMAGNEFGRLVGFSRFYVRDEFAVLANDRGTPREREIETPADGSQHFAMLPPKFGGMAV